MFSLPLWLILAMIAVSVWAAYEAYTGVKATKVAHEGPILVEIPDARRVPYTLSELWAGRKRKG